MQSGKWKIQKSGIFRFPFSILHFSAPLRRNKN